VGAGSVAPHQLTPDDQLLDLRGNRTRLHSTLAYISPVQFEQNWLATQPKQAKS